MLPVSSALRRSRRGGGPPGVRIVAQGAIFAGNLRRLCPDLHTWTAIARRAGVHATMISRYVNGRAVPTNVVIQRAAMHLNVSVDDLMRPLPPETPVAPKASLVVADLAELVMHTSQKKQSLIGKIAGLPDHLVDDAYTAIDGLEKAWWKKHGGAAPDAAGTFPDEDE